MLADGIAREEKIVFSRASGPVRTAAVDFGGTAGILAKPTTYMNRSGAAARALRDDYPELPLSNWLVVADDLDLPFGKLRVRAEGGAGGHNGLRSIIEALGTEEFPRLRMGIGRPAGASRAEVVDWVLEPFDEAEHSKIPSILQAAGQGVRAFAREGVTAAMNRTNAWAIRPQTPTGDA
jgi:PTH1 family peptidyl-tRNA hydrolase